MLFSVAVFSMLGILLNPTFATDEKTGAVVKISGEVSAAIKHISKSVPPPKTANKDALAAEIDLTYPEFSCSKGQNDAVSTINKSIQSILLSSLEEKCPTVEKLVETFLQKYEQSFKENPDESLGGWFLKFESKIRHCDEDLVCLETLLSVFQGGAHPTSNITYQVFSLKTGKEIPLSELVPEEKMVDLTKVAEKHFRRVRGLKPDETYENAGFQFEQNKFALNKNFLFSKDGLAFCFNQYEIAPYAMGPTEIVIPWEDLKNLIDSKGPVGRFLKSH